MLIIVTIWLIWQKKYIGNLRWRHSPVSLLEPAHVVEGETTKSDRFLFQMKRKRKRKLGFFSLTQTIHNSILFRGFKMPIDQIKATTDWICKDGRGSYRSRISFGVDCSSANDLLQLYKGLWGTDLPIYFRNQTSKMALFMEWVS